MCVCDNGFYQDSISEKCLDCSDGCQKCTGSSVDQCLDCIKKVDGWCISECPSFYTTSTDGSCTSIDKMSEFLIFDSFADTFLSKPKGL